VLHTDFSGKRSAEATLLMQGEAMKFLGMNVPDKWLTLWRACDNDRVCQDIVLKSKMQPRHMFHSLERRVPERFRIALNKIRPAPLECAKKSVPQFEIEMLAKKYKEMGAYISDNQDDMFGWDHVSDCCLLHPGKACRLHWDGVGAAPDANSDDDEPLWKALTSCIAGPMCTPWTHFGAEMRLADPATESWIMWVSEIEKIAYDLTTMENSSMFDIKLFEDAFDQQKFKVIGVVTGPEDVSGFPCMRTRYFGTAINQENLVWVGPPTPEEIREEYYKQFGCKVLLDADCFAGIDDAVSMQDYHKHLSSKRGVYQSGDKPLNIRHLLAPHQKAHYDEYRAQCASGQKRGYLSGAFVCDLSQNCSLRNRSGPWFPAFAKSTTLASLSTERDEANHAGGYIFTPNELNFSQGWPTCDFVVNRKYMACMDDLSKLPYSQQADLMGNGIHLPTLSSWLLFVASNLVRRDVLSAMPPTLTYVMPIEDKRPIDVEDDDGDSKSDTCGEITPEFGAEPGEPSTLEFEAELESRFGFSKLAASSAVALMGGSGNQWMQNLRLDFDSDDRDEAEEDAPLMQVFDSIPTADGAANIPSQESIGFSDATLPLARGLDSDMDDSNRPGV
jgi:hypothetical protein